MRRVAPAKTLWKKAFRACEKALIAAVNRRDKVCQLCRGTNVLQMDHAIVSRKHLSTFFEIRQMVLLCRSCHGQKTWKNYGTEIRVADIVRHREGAHFIKQVVEDSRQVKKWTIQELEDMRAGFENLYTQKKASEQ